MSFVVDASVVIAWYFEESNSLPEEAIEKIEEEGAVIPALFLIECANTFALGVRTRKLTKDLADSYFESVLELELEIDNEAAEHAMHIYTLALQHQLTTYDATYLELAKRRKLPLATLDKALRAAAKKEKVALL